MVSSTAKYDEYQESILRTIVEQHEQEQQQQQQFQIAPMNDQVVVSRSSRARGDDDGDSEGYSDSATSTSQLRNLHDGGNHIGTGNENDGFKIAEREDVFVIRMRIIVVLSLVLSSTALALVMYYLAKGEEMNDFRNEVRRDFFLMFLMMGPAKRSLIHKCLFFLYVNSRFANFSS
jgi:hypothetical protein